jgi:hypothetical protein
MENRALLESITSIAGPGWICPQPQKWQELWDLLPVKERTGGGWNPSLPLILAAWWDATDCSKQARFLEHLAWAETHGTIEEALDYLRKLNPSDWFRGN